MNIIRTLIQALKDCIEYGDNPDVENRAMIAIVEAKEFLLAGKVKDQICPACFKHFELSWNKRPFTIDIHYCSEGGVYGVTLECPYCNYREEL